MDEDENIQFKGYLLEEIKPKTQNISSNETSTGILTIFLEKFPDFRKPKRCNWKNLCEKLVIEKFTKKTSSVTQRMDIFETECTRIGIIKDITKRYKCFGYF